MPHFLLYKPGHDVGGLTGLALTFNHQKGSLEENHSNLIKMKTSKSSFKIDMLAKFNVPNISCPTIRCKEYYKWGNKHKIQGHLGGSMVYLTGWKGKILLVNASSLWADWKYLAFHEVCITFQLTKQDRPTCRIKSLLHYDLGGRDDIECSRSLNRFRDICVATSLNAFMPCLSEHRRVTY